MAARKKFIRHDERTRQKIQTSQIINRLKKHIDGEVELSTSQVRAAEILLKKTLPDLSQTTLEGGDKPIQYATVSDQPETTQEWLKNQSSGDPKQDHSTH